MQSETALTDTLFLSFFFLYVHYILYVYVLSYKGGPPSDPCFTMHTLDNPWYTLSMREPTKMVRVNYLTWDLVDELRQITTLSTAQILEFAVTHYNESPELQEERARFARLASPEPRPLPDPLERPLIPKGGPYNEGPGQVAWLFRVGLDRDPADEGRTVSRDEQDRLIQRAAEFGLDMWGDPK
jgi:hypothetical protein